MRILFAGATGVLGRATLPHLSAHDVFGLTRSADKLTLLRHLGAEGMVCDVYDFEALLQVARRVRPETIVNFVTDLSAGSLEANNRARRVGGANLLEAATQIHASRFVVESVAFTLDGDAARAVEQLERSARDFQGECLILRFGRLWGPGTSYDTLPPPPTIHIDQAGAEGARLVADGHPGIYTIA